MRRTWLLGALLLAACVEESQTPTGDPIDQMAGIDDIPLQGDGVDNSPEQTPVNLSDSAPAPLEDEPPELAAVLEVLGVGDDGVMASEAPAEAAPADPEPETEPAPQPEAEPEGPPASVEEAIQRARRDNRLGPLTRDRALDVAAARHLRDMQLSGFYGQRGSDGSVLPDRVNRVGFCFRRLEQNLARGEELPERVLRQWLVGNPRERANLLMEDADSFGLAGADGVWVLIVAEAC